VARGATGTPARTRQEPREGPPSAAPQGRAAWRQRAIPRLRSRPASSGRSDRSHLAGPRPPFSWIASRGLGEAAPGRSRDGGDGDHLAAQLPSGASASGLAVGQVHLGGTTILRLGRQGGRYSPTRGGWCGSWRRGRAVQRADVQHVNEDSASAPRGGGTHRPARPLVGPLDQTRQIGHHESAVVGQLHDAQCGWRG